MRIGRGAFPGGSPRFYHRRPGPFATRPGDGNQWARIGEAQHGDRDRVPLRQAAFHRRWEVIRRKEEFLAHASSILRVIAVPMALHGLYDTTLKKEMDFYALMTAVAGFAWLAYQVESARGREEGWSKGPDRDAWPEQRAFDA